MLHTHSVIYRRGSELAVLLNNALQSMHRHDCTVHPDNKFVKFTDAMDKTFNQVTETQSIYKVTTKFSVLFLDSSHFYPLIRL
jgi:hypothetical protein